MWHSWSLRGLWLCAVFRHTEQLSGLSWHFTAHVIRSFSDSKHTNSCCSDISPTCGQLRPALTRAKRQQVHNKNTYYHAHHIGWSIFSRTNLRFWDGKMHFLTRPQTPPQLTMEEKTPVRHRVHCSGCRRRLRRRRGLSHGSSSGLQVRGKRCQAGGDYRRLSYLADNSRTDLHSHKTSPTSVSNFSHCRSSHVASVNYTFTISVKTAFPTHFSVIWDQLKPATATSE